MHVWAWDFACSPQQLAQFTAILSDEERHRMRRFHFERHRVRYAVCHGNLRRLLSSYLQLQPSLLQFEENAYGKPKLVDSELIHSGPAGTRLSNSQLSNSQLSNSEWNFNLSHTADVALLGIARSMAIGVDVEHIRPIEADIAEQYFSPHELLELADLTETSWLQGFYNCWTRKEAILKAEGVGLNVRLDAFDVSLAPGAQPQLIAHRAEAGLKTQWLLSALKPSDGTVGAIATSHAPVQLHCWTLASQLDETK